MGCNRFEERTTGEDIVPGYTTGFSSRAVRVLLPRPFLRNLVGSRRVVGRYVASGH